MVVYNCFTWAHYLFYTESWIIDKATERKLVSFENKVLRKIFEPIRDDGKWTTKHNKEIKDRFKAPDAVAEAKSQSLWWAKHIIRREDDTWIKYGKETRMKEVLLDTQRGGGKMK